jgi:hypothetical protein
MTFVTFNLLQAEEALAYARNAAKVRRGRVTIVRREHCYEVRWYSAGEPVPADRRI